MKLTITHNQLVEHEACSDGLSAFNYLNPSGVMTLDWTPETQLEVLHGPLRKYVFWAASEKLIPMYSLEEVDLSGIDFSEASFFRANLRRANLRRADLREANLREANMVGADLRWADLREAYLSGATMSDVQRDYAKSQGAIV